MSARGLEKDLKVVQTKSAVDLLATYKSNQPIMQLESLFKNSPAGVLADDRNSTNSHSISASEILAKKFQKHMESREPVQEY